VTNLLNSHGYLAKKQKKLWVIKLASGYIGTISQNINSPGMSYDNGHIQDEAADSLPLP
jgi:hypothetical protein